MRFEGDILGVQGRIAIGATAEMRPLIASEIALRARVSNDFDIRIS
jgi:hypothetical protein